MRLAPLMAAAVLLAVAGSAGAQEAVDGEYRTIVGEAVSEFNAGRFTEARALFRTAHGISPNARTLLGIGMSSFELRDYVEACRALELAIDEPARALDEAQRTEASTILGRARRFVGVYAVDVAPAGAVIRLDGAAPTTLRDGRLVVAIGDHVLSASLDGWAAGSLSVTASGGEEGTLRLELAPIEPPSVAVVEDEPPIDAPLVPPVETAGPDRTVAIVLVAAGGAAVAGGLVAGLGGWWTRENELASCHTPPAGFVCDNEGTLVGERDGSAAATLTLAALGVASLATGFALWTTADGGTLACLPAGPGLACAARF